MFKTMAYGRDLIQKSQPKVKFISQYAFEVYFYDR